MGAGPGYFKAWEYIYSYDCDGATGLIKINDDSSLITTDYATISEPEMVWIYVKTGLETSPTDEQVFWTSNGNGGGCGRLVVDGNNPVQIDAPTGASFDIATGESTGSIKVYGFGIEYSTAGNFGDKWFDYETFDCDCGLYGTCSHIMEMDGLSGSVTQKWCPKDKVEELDTTMGGMDLEPPACHYSYDCDVESHACENAQVTVGDERTTLSECESATTEDGGPSCWSSGSTYLAWKSHPLEACTGGNPLQADSGTCFPWIYGDSDKAGLMKDMDVSSIPGFDNGFKNEWGSTIDFYTDNYAGDGKCRMYRLYILSESEYNAELAGDAFNDGSLSNGVLSNLVDSRDAINNQDFAIYCCPWFTYCNPETEKCDTSCGHKDNDGQNLNGCSVDDALNGEECDPPTPPPTPTPNPDAPECSCYAPSPGDDPTYGGTYTASISDAMGENLMDGNRLKSPLRHNTKYAIAVNNKSEDRKDFVQIKFMRYDGSRNSQVLWNVLDGDTVEKASWFQQNVRHSAIITTMTFDVDGVEIHFRDLSLDHHAISVREVLDESAIQPTKPEWERWIYGYSTPYCGDEECCECVDGELTPVEVAHVQHDDVLYYHDHPHPGCGSGTQRICGDPHVTTFFGEKFDM